jgi:hypothetical protein
MYLMNYVTDIYMYMNYDMGVRKLPVHSVL